MCISPDRLAKEPHGVSRLCSLRIGITNWSFYLFKHRAWSILGWLFTTQLELTLNWQKWRYS